MSWDHAKMMEFADAQERLGQLLVNMAEEGVLEDERLGPAIDRAELKNACTQLLLGLNQILCLQTRTGIMNAFHPCNQGRR